MKSLILLILLFTITCHTKGQSVIFLSSDKDLYKKDKLLLSSSSLKKILFSGELAAFVIQDEQNIKREGLVNKQGKVLISPEYFKVQVLPNDFIAIQKFDRHYYFYHPSSNLISTEACDSFFFEQNVICWRSHQQWGALVAEKKKVNVIQPIYKSISINDDKLIGLQFNSWIPLNDNHKIKLLADSIYFLNENLIVFIDGNLKGLATTDGKLLTQALYSEISSLDHNSYLVLENFKYKVLNSQGKNILPLNYDTIMFNNGYYRTYEKEKGWKLYNTDGSPVTKNFYCEIALPSEDFIAVKFEQENQCTQWGYINTKEEIIIPPSYSSALPFENGLAVVEYQGEKGVINKQATWVIDPSYYPLYSSGLLSISEDGKLNSVISRDKYSFFQKAKEGIVLVKDNNFYGLINQKGKLLLPTEFTQIKGPYFDSIFVVNKGKSIGIFTEGGYFLSEPHDRFEKLYEFKEGRAMFIKGGKIGFIDLRGNIRVAPQYKEARNYHEGAAAVLLNGKWAFIDPDESILVQPLYQEVKDFRNGLSRCRTGKQWSFVGKDGKVVSKLTYDDIKEEENNKWYLIKNGKIGLGDVNGREQLAPRYEYVKDIGNNRVIVKKAGKWGIVDYKENFLVPFEYDGIIYNQQKNMLLVMIKGITEEINISNENQ
jgi:hypothetical protein